MGKRHRGRRLLLALAGFLKELPPERFNYDEWVGHDWRGDSKLSCGTTACAIGWATTMPIFRRLGLRLLQEDNGYGYPVIVRDGIVDVAGGFNVVMHLFGITIEDAIRLFAPGNEDEKIASPGYVADKIERFVSAKEEWA